MPPREWCMAKAQLAILFEDRFKSGYQSPAEATRYWMAATITAQEAA